MTTTLLIWATALFGLSLVITAVCVLLYVIWRKESKKPYPGHTKTLLRNWIITCVSFIVILSFPIGICTFVAVDQGKTEAVSMETALNTQYVTDQNILSTYVTGYQEQLGVANLQSTKIAAIITQAVAGQGSIKDLIDPAQSPLYTALAEAFPTVTLSQYQNLITYIQTGRQAFQDAQSDLLQKLGDFDTWRQSGFIFQPLLVSVTGAPNSVLRITVGKKIITGAAAETEMWEIVRNPMAVADFTSGVETALPAGK